MINAVIIDDEKDARFLLRNLLQQHASHAIHIIGEADDVDSGVEIINRLKPDVIFLDIKMRKGTGFDLLQKIDSTAFEVIFITAYDNYAVKAFQFSAFGYLMKPIKIQELKGVVAKLEAKSQTKKESPDKRFKVLIENYGDDRKIKKLVVPDMEGFKVVTIEDILRLEGERNYTQFVLIGGRKIMVSKSLGEYEELLNEHGFFRIHQSTIINLRHVKGYIKGDGGKVEMTDGVLLQISRYRKTEFMERFI